MRAERSALALNVQREKKERERVQAVDFHWRYATEPRAPSECECGNNVNSQRERTRARFLLSDTFFAFIVVGDLGKIVAVSLVAISARGLLPLMGKLKRVMYG